MGARVFSGFIKARHGNIAMLFGLLVIPLIAAVGLGIDTSRNAFVRTQLNEAADAALLAAARAHLTDSDMSMTEAEAIAQKYFDANKISEAGVTVQDVALAHDSSSDVYTLTTTATVRSTFMAAVGRGPASLSILSEAKAARARPLEVALVLDTTYSMKGKKLADLKKAAKDMVDSLMDDASAPVKIGVVPFSNYVNVGLDVRNQSWLDVENDSTTYKQNCWNTYPNSKQVNCRQVKSTCTKTERSNCRKVKKTCTRTRDGVSETYDCSYEQCDEKKSSSSCMKEVCDEDKGKPVKKCNTQKKEKKWRGCVGSRDYPLNVHDTDYRKNRVPGLMNLNCGKPLQPLTADKKAVVKAINTMNPNFETYIPAGLAWGMRVLSPGDPFSEGDTFSDADLEAGAKVLVLMTDGANTKSPTYPKHDGGNAGLANDLTEELCEELRAMKYVVYAIAFEVTDSTIKSLLQSCATREENYFDATDSEKLSDAFRDSTVSMMELSLTR